MIPSLQRLALSIEHRIWCVNRYLALNRGDRERAAECADMANRALRQLELLTMRLYV